VFWWRRPGTGIDVVDTAHADVAGGHGRPRDQLRLGIRCPSGIHRHPPHDQRPHDIAPTRTGHGSTIGHPHACLKVHSAFLRGESFVSPRPALSGAAPVLSGIAEPDRPALHPTATAARRCRSSTSTCTTQPHGALTKSRQAGSLQYWSPCQHLGGRCASELLGSERGHGLCPFNFGWLPSGRLA